MSALSLLHCFFSFTDPATTEIYTLSLHDALPIYLLGPRRQPNLSEDRPVAAPDDELYGASYRLQLHSEVGEHLGVKRSEEHTSELQSRQYLVCRLLLEKKKKIQKIITFSVTQAEP